MSKSVVLAFGIVGIGIAGLFLIFFSGFGWLLLISGASRVPPQSQMVPSAYRNILEARQIDDLFGPAWHQCSNYEKPDTVEFQTETYVAQRYRMMMVVRIRIDRRTGRFIEEVGEPHFYLNRISKVDPGGYGTFFDAQEDFGRAQWQRVVEAGGDFSVIGIEVETDNPVPGFSELNKVYRRGMQFVETEDVSGKTRANTE